MPENILLLLLLSLSLKASCQRVDSSFYKSKLFYVDLGSNFFVNSFSLNREKNLHLSSDEKFQVYSRYGIAFAALLNGNPGRTFEYGDAGPGFLGGISLVYGSGKHHFESSGGILLFLSPRRLLNRFGIIPLPLFDLGYRFQRPGKSTIFRAKIGLTGIGLSLGKTLF